MIGLYYTAVPKSRQHQSQMEKYDNKSTGSKCGGNAWARHAGCVNTISVMKGRST
jgi:hypothetical protein